MAGSTYEGVTQGLCHSLLVGLRMRKLYRSSHMGVCSQPEDMYLCRQRTWSWVCCRGGWLHSPSLKQSKCNPAPCSRQLHCHLLLPYLA